MKVSVLSSGSKGNVTYLEVSNKKFLLDAGRNYKYIHDSLEAINVDIKDIDYILISHNHDDHISALKTLVTKTKATVILSQKLFYLLPDLKDYPHIIVLEDEITIDNIKITSFNSSHDAPDARNFIIEADGKRLAYITDTGYINQRNFKYLKNLDIYLMESNHDVEMLQHGPYPPWLKKRVLSDVGHLSNNSAGFYLSKLLGNNTKKVILIHLSETNNLEELALDTVHNTLKEYNIHFDNIICAHQNEITEVIEV